MIRPLAAPGMRPAGRRLAASRAPGAGIDRASGGRNEALSDVLVFIVSHLSWIAIVSVVLAHVVFAQAEFPLPTRLLTAVPAVLCLLEARAHLRAPKGELPFMVMALLQYYVSFCSAVFFDLTFYDLTGPVHFTETTRIAAGLAVALGGLTLSAGGRLGIRLGRDFRAGFLRSLPPADLPRRWDDAFYVYCAVAVLATLVATFTPGMIPQALALPITYTLSFEFAMGLALACPPRKLGLKAAQGFVALGIVIALFHGMLDLIFRVGMEYVAGRWATVRRISLRVVAVVAVLFLALQPIKQRFRDQVWTQEAKSGVATGVTGRVSAWQSALSYYGEDNHAKSETDNAAIERMSELGSVMHAIQVIPVRVDYLDGAGFVQILYSPIPRLIWPDKPTTKDTVQRYAVIFGRQTERGAETTAITLPLVVEGYWNFGWVGVALVCGAVGLWMGLSQQLFAGEHWALRAMGFTQFTNITVAQSIVFLYGSLFQNFLGRMVACWVVYWLAKLLSGRREARDAPVGLRRASVAGAR